MGSGVASASTLSRAFAGDYFKEFLDLPTIPVAIAFLLLVAAINLRGIAESVRVNLGLTLVEVTGLLLIVLVGVGALLQGDADFGRNFEFKQGESALLAIGAVVCVVLVVKSTVDDPAILLRAGLILLLGVLLFGIQYALGHRGGPLRADVLRWGRSRRARRAKSGPESVDAQSRCPGA